jgi:Flp pilus assembly protein TadD
MTNKLKIILITSVGALLLLSVALWFLVLQPDLHSVAKQEEVLLASGIRLFKEKKFNESLETLARIPSGSTQEAKARYYQGSAYMMLKDYESAADNLEQALVLDSQDVGVFYGLGVAYYKLGNLKLARGYFASVLEINPNDEHAKGLMDILAKLERNPGSEIGASTGY